jgi:hypothetical protein
MEDDELRNAVGSILKEQPEPQIKRVALIYDGKQYSIRVPREFAETLGLEKGKFAFEFKLILPAPLDQQEKPRLEGRVIDA